MIDSLRLQYTRKGELFSWSLPPWTVSWWSPSWLGGFLTLRPAGFSLVDKELLVGFVCFCFFWTHFLYLSSVGCGCMWQFLFSNAWCLLSSWCRIQSLLIQDNFRGIGILAFCHLPMPVCKLFWRTKIFSWNQAWKYSYRFASDQPIFGQYLGPLMGYNILLL